MDGELERRAAPDRVGICGPHLEQMIARLDIGEGDAALRAEIEPPVGQARHAVGEAIALRGGEIERAEVERQDVGPVAEVDALEEPIGLRSRRRRAEHLDARERHVRRPAVLGEACGIEDVESAGTAEGEASVAQAKVGAEVELLALQAVLAMVGLDARALRVVPGEPRIPAHPHAAGGVRHHPVHGVAREALLARQHLEADGIGGRDGSLHQGESAAVGRDPHLVTRIHGERIDGVRGQAREVPRVVAEYLHDGTVRARQVEPAALGAEPEIPARVFRDRGDVGRADRARRAGAVRQLADAAARGVDDVHAAAVRADPDLTVARLEEGHDAGGAQGMRIARLYAYGLQPPVGRELAQAARKGPDPERAVPILMERHHALIADGVAAAGDRVDGGGFAAVIVVQREAASKRGDPHLVIGRFGERGHQLVSQPGRAVPAELPAARIPAADAARARSNPHQAGGILVQRHDERVAQRIRIARVMTVVAELAGGAIQHVETGRSPDPQMPRLILEQRPHVVCGERSGVLRVVTQHLQQLAGVIQAAEPRIGRADPERAGGVLQHARDVAATDRAQVRETMMLGLPALEPGLGADPERPGAIEQKRVDVVVDDGARVAGIMTQVLDASGCGLEDVQPRVEGSDPDAIAGVHQQRVDGIAGERAGVLRIVAVDEEAVGGALPARETAALDGDPQIVVTILDDGLDVVARQPAVGGARVGVAEQLVAVVAHQAVLGREPHEPLRILQRREHRALRQAVGSGQVLENERRIGGARAQGRREQARGRGESRGGPDAPVHAGAHAPRMHGSGSGCVDRSQACCCRSALRELRHSRLTGWVPRSRSMPAR